LRGECGTPIKYREIGGQYISLFLNSLDDPNAVAPEIAFSPNAMKSWRRTLEDLRGRDLNLAHSDGFISNQR
jgi:hypothetical protein